MTRLFPKYETVKKNINIESYDDVNGVSSFLKNITKYYDCTMTFTLKGTLKPKYKWLEERSGVK